MTAHYAEQLGGAYLSVRFGNVLSSRGSVLTAFQAQIQAGLPITVTHPDVTRYFMTVQEAVHLVLQAATIGRGGEALVLDMGEPVRIADVARRLAAEASTRTEIVFTGLRPGEKLHEDLFGADEVDSRPLHPLISHVRVPALFPDEVRPVRGPGGTGQADGGRLRGDRDGGAGASRAPLREWLPRIRSPGRAGLGKVGRGVPGSLVGGQFLPPPAAPR